MKLNQISVQELEIKQEQAQELSHMGINTISDLLFHFPHRYEDYRLSELGSVEQDEKVTVQGQICSPPSVRWFGKKKSRLIIKLDVGGLHIQIIWFNQPYLKKKLNDGEFIGVSGRWDPKKKQIVADRTFISKEEQKKQIGR